jgi:hypothetical protein
MTLHRVCTRWVRHYTNDADFRYRVLFGGIAASIVFFVLIWPLFDGLLAFSD